jgi:hypothetical protein
MLIQRQPRNNFLVIEGVHLHRWLRAPRFRFPEIVDLRSPRQLLAASR